MQMPTVKVSGRYDADAAMLAEEIIPSYQPAVLKGLAKEWPAVRAALTSPADACRYLAGFDRGATVDAFVGPPEIGGRFFYGPDMGRFNFQKQRAPLASVLEHLAKQAGAEGSPSIYIGAASVSECLPGFEEENPLPMLDGTGAVPRIWIGNRTSVATHFDLSDNVACVVAGRRRFILFPPEQLPNLYVGPLDHTMAGQPASMVSVHDPDFDRYPRFREAWDAALMAELEPGDAIYIPALWWHNVDALAGVNILVNYWWDDAPADAGSPFEALAHALLATKHLDASRREAWRSIFDHYIFRKNGDPAAHIPPEHRGILGPSTPQLRARMRQFLIRAFGRR